MSTDTNLCDVIAGQHTVAVYRLNKLILSKHKGRDFTVAPDVELHELIAAAITLDHGETVTVYRESITGSVENTALPSTEKIEVMSCPTGNPNEFTAYGYATHITTNVLVPGAHQFYVTPTCWARKQADWCDFNPEWSEMDDNPVVVYFRHAGETHRSCYFSPMAHGLYDTWDEMLEEIARTHAHREQVLERHFAKKEKA